MLVDLRSKGISGQECEELMDSANITCNKNSIPYDTAGANHPNASVWALLLYLPAACSPRTWRPLPSASTCWSTSARLV